MSRHKLTIYLFVAVSLVFTFVTRYTGGVNIAYAQGVATPALDSVVSGIAVIVGMLITMLNVLMWILFFLLDFLLRPEIIFDLKGVGGASNLVDILHNIWQLSRDIVNLLFVFVLIGGAIMTIVTGNMEKITKNAPNFIIAIVLVNFSWFIPRAIYDASQVAANTVFEIPLAFSNYTCQVKDSEGNKKPCLIVTEMRFLEDTKSVTPVGNWSCPLPDLVCYRWANYDDVSASNSMFSNILNGLIINYANLRNLAQPETFNGPAPVGIGATLTFIVKMVIVLGIHIALFFPMLALVAVFLIRIPILWVTMAFMPFVVLGYAGVKSKDFDPIEKIGMAFINAAFLPALVGIPFAVGFVMINAGMQQTEIVTIAGGKLPLIPGVSNIWQMFWLLLSIGVLWVGVFNALKGKGYFETVANKIKSQGEGLGKFVLNLPMNIPFMPAPGGAGGMLTLGKTKTAMRDMAWRNERGDLFNKDAKNPAEGIGHAWDQMKPNGQQKAETKIRDEILKAPPEQRHEKIEQLRTIMREELAGNKDASSALQLADKDEVLLEALAAKLPDHSARLRQLATEIRKASAAGAPAAPAAATATPAAPAAAPTPSPTPPPTVPPPPAPTTTTPPGGPGISGA